MPGLLKGIENPLNKKRRRLEQRRLNLRNKSLVHPIGLIGITVTH